MPLVTVALSGILALLAAEALLRVYPLVDDPRHRPDALLGHRLVEGFRGWCVNGGDGGRRWLTVNSHGLLDVEYPLEKPPGGTRILLLGDSYSEAVHVEFDEMFHSRLERQLHDRSAARPVEIINAGVAGYGTDNMLLFYRHVGRAYRPDLALMTFVTNDLEDNCRELQLRSGDVDKEPYFSLAGDALTLHDHPYLRQGDGLRQSLHRLSKTYHLAWRLAFTRQRQKRAENAKLGLPYQFPIHLADDDPDYEQAWQLLKALYRAVRDETAADGAQLAVIIVTCSQQVHERHRAWFEQRYPQMADYEWDWEKPNRRVREICQDLQIPCLDLLPAFTAAAARDDAELHFLGGHWTAAGHAVAARELEEFLDEHFPELLGGAPAKSGPDTGGVN